MSDGAYLVPLDSTIRRESITRRLSVEGRQHSEPGPKSFVACLAGNRPLPHAQKRFPFKRLSVIKREIKRRKSNDRQTQGLHAPPSAAAMESKTGESSVLARMVVQGKGDSERYPIGDSLGDAQEACVPLRAIATESKAGISALARMVPSYEGSHRSLEPHIDPKVIQKLNTPWLSGDAVAGPKMATDDNDTNNGTR